MIAELFLTCALALPTPSIHANGKEEFIQEYNWIKDLIKKSYPGYEIKIVPDDIGIPYIPGWDRLPMKWREHSVYIRRTPPKLLENA